MVNISQNYRTLIGRSPASCRNLYMAIKVISHFRSCQCLIFIASFGRGSRPFDVHCALHKLNTYLGALLHQAHQAQCATAKKLECICM